MSLSVIIPSRNAANLVPCVEAVRKCEPDARLFISDDGIDLEAIERQRISWEPDRQLHWERAIRFSRCQTPFIFARNCNHGIQGAGADDVILLNDDALLESPGGFTAMQLTAKVHGLGLVSATTNLAGNPEQHRRGISGVRTLLGNTPGNSFPTVAFVCVLIPRTTIELIGMLDERFNCYGWEDNDYCRRIHNAGLKIGVHDGCYVDHAKLHSTFRGQAYAAGDINAGRKIYMEKWGSV